MIPMYVCLHLFVWGYTICPCESIALTSEGINNGTWNVEDHSSVTLVCTVSPFAGILMWRFNSSKVAECTIQYCRQISTGDGAFMFGFDTANGLFTWSISPVVKKKHNGQLFECYDGSNTLNVTAHVTETNEMQTDKECTCSHNAISLVGVILGCLNFLIEVAVIITIAIICKMLRAGKYNPALKDIPQSSGDSTTYVLTGQYNPGLIDKHLSSRDSTTNVCSRQIKFNLEHKSQSFPELHSEVFNKQNDPDLKRKVHSLLDLHDKDYELQVIDQDGQRMENTQNTNTTTIEAINSPPPRLYPDLTVINKTQHGSSAKM